MTASKRILIIARTERGREDRFRYGVLTERGQLPNLHKRGPHSRRPESVSTRPGRSSGGQADVEHDS